jgi:hypothetical protein
MPKQAISVTLDAENLTWLKGRAGASGLRSVSELLDHIVSAARASGGAGVSRSVAGTIEIGDADPLLERADAAIRALFAASFRRPFVTTDSLPEARLRTRTRRRG